MPKRKATSKLSGLMGLDDEDEDVMPDEVIPDTITREHAHEEPPAKKPRGRPRIVGTAKAGSPRATSKKVKTAPVTGMAKSETVNHAVKDLQTKRKGKLKGAGSSDGLQGRTLVSGIDEEDEDEQHMYEANAIDSESPKQTGSTNVRGRNKAASSKQTQVDDEFEYTPSSSRLANRLEQSRDRAMESTKRRDYRGVSGSAHRIEEREAPADGATLDGGAQLDSATISSPIRKPTKGRPSQRIGGVYESPRKAGVYDVEKVASEPELRRRLGDLSKKYDVLETRYRNLKEIGVTEANANMEKLKRHCESITAGKQCFYPPTPFHDSS